MSLMTSMRTPRDFNARSTSEVIWVRAGRRDIAVAAPDGNELVAEAQPIGARARCRWMHLSGAVGSLTGGKDLWMLGRIAKLAGQAHHIGVVKSLSNGGHTGADPG